MSMDSIYQGVYFAFIGIFLTLFYYGLERGFLEDVAIGRLVGKRVSRGILSNYIDLTISYSLFMQLFFYLNFKFSRFIPMYAISKESTIILGFSLLFLGRLIAVFQGETHSRNYINGLFIYRTSFLAAMITLLENLQNSGTNISEMVLLLHSDIYSFLIYSEKYPMDSIFFGIITLVIASELPLSLYRKKLNSLDDLSQLMPSGFQVIKKKDFNDKIKKIIKTKNIETIKIISNSSEFIDLILSTSLQDDLRLIRAKQAKIFIIRTPLKRIILNYERMSQSKPTSIGDLNSEHYLKNNFIEKISDDEEKLNRYAEAGCIMMKYQYLGNFDLLVVVELPDNSSITKNKIFISFNSSDIYHGDSVIYTQLPIIGSVFLSAFYRIWNSIK